MTAANTLTEKDSGVIGDLKYTIREYDVQTYPTGGLSILPGDVGMKLLKFVQVTSYENAYIPLFVNADKVHESFEIALTTGSFSAGDCTVTVDGQDITVAYAAADTDASKEALAMRTALATALAGRFVISGATSKCILTAIDECSHTVVYAAGDTGVTAAITVTSNFLKLYDVVDADGAESGTTEDVVELTATTDAGLFRLFILGK